MVGEENEIKFDGGKVVLDNNRIVKFITEVDKLELDHAENFMQCLAENNFRRDVLVLFDAKSLKEVTDGAVKKYTVQKLENHAKALAVLNNSPITRFLIHTFLAIYRPNIPIKLFEDELKAKVWLLEIKDR